MKSKVDYFLPQRLIWLLRARSNVGYTSGIVQLGEGMGVKMIDDSRETISRDVIYTTAQGESKKDLQNSKKASIVTYKVKVYCL